MINEIIRMAKVGFGQTKGPVELPALYFTLLSFLRIHRTSCFLNLLEHLAAIVMVAITKVLVLLLDTTTIIIVTTTTDTTIIAIADMDDGTNSL